MADGATNTARRRKAQAPSSTNPVDIAMEAESGDASADSPARRVLLKQEKLIGWQIASERAAVALRVLTGAAGVAAALALAWMVWSASRADGLVIEAFSTPPSLAERGITGEAVARRLMDEVNAMAGSFTSSERQRRLAGSWQDNISIQIPSTGVSLAQLDQWLRDRLGKQRHAGGEVRLAPDGRVTLFVRSGPTALKPMTGAEADLDTMISAAAEQIFAIEQPRTYVSYLQRTGRDEQARPILIERTNNASADVRAVAFNILAQAPTASHAERLALFHLAVDAYPYSAWQNNLAGTQLEVGQWEAAYQTYSRSIRDGVALPDSVGDALTRYKHEAAARRARLTGDFQEEIKASTPLAERLPAGRCCPENNTYPGTIAIARARLHDGAAARAGLSAFRPLDDPPNPVKTRAQAELAEDWNAYVEATDAIIKRAIESNRLYAPSLAEKAAGLLNAGRAGEAQAVLETTGLDCFPCVVQRGRVAQALGQPALADHWFGEAVKMAPSLPWANLEWGRALLKRGELDEAFERCAAANKQSPKFADPKTCLGEVLLRQGKPGAAIKLLRQSDRQAPKWGRTHMLWGEALAKLGKADEAKAQWKTAQGLHLTAAERAELARLTKGAR